MWPRTPGLAAALILSVVGCDAKTESPPAGNDPEEVSADASHSNPDPDPDGVESGSTEPRAPVEARDGDGGEARCGDETCEAPRTCVRYYGIAGPSGPEFTSCEIRCKKPGDGSCPEGLRCVTVADGPGTVCR